MERARFGEVVDPAGRERIRRRVVSETVLAVAGSTVACYLTYLALGLKLPATGTGGLVMMIAPIATPLAVAPFAALPFARASERVTRLLLEVEETKHRLTREIAERAAVQERLEELVRRDPLTGLLNRRGFFELTADRAGRDLVLLVLDVDDFKLVNDSWGHAAGDAVLRAIAAHLGRASTRADVARIGGDEFAVVAGVAVASELEGLERGLAGLPVELPDGTTTTVSCSTGRAPLPATRSVDAALAEADARMYGAKRRRAGASAPPVGTERLLR